MSNMSKTAAAPTLENNESSMIRPVELEPDAKGVEHTETHANQEHNGEAAWQSFLNDSPQLLGRAFPGFKDAASKDKAFIHENFSTRGYESRAPQLRKYAEAGLIPSAQSLAERTRGLLPR